MDYEKVIHLLKKESEINNGPVGAFARTLACVFEMAAEPTDARFGPMNVETRISDVTEFPGLPNGLYGKTLDPTDPHWNKNRPPDEKAEPGYQSPPGIENGKTVRIPRDHYNRLIKERDDAMAISTVRGNNIVKLEADVKRLALKVANIKEITDLG